MTAISASSQQTADQAGIVSATSEQVGQNVTTVATPIEEMTASVTEIAESAPEAAIVAGQAVEKATRTNETVARLVVVRDRAGHRDHHLDRGTDQPARAQRQCRRGDRGDRGGHPQDLRASADHRVGVDEQTATTSEISRNIAEAAAGVDEDSRGVGRVAASARAEIAAEPASDAAPNGVARTSASVAEQLDDRPLVGV